MQQLTDVSRRRIVISMACLAVAMATLALLLLYAPWLRTGTRSRPRPSIGYPLVQKGMTQEQVLETMGRPTETLAAEDVPEAKFWEAQPLPPKEAAEATLSLVYGVRGAGQPVYVITCAERSTVVGKKLAE